MKNIEYKKLYSECERLADGPDYRMSNYALNVINTALDFQQNVVSVNKAMNYYDANMGYRSHRGLKGIISEFPNSERGNRRLSQELWSNNMWTRAQFMRVLLNEFETRGIKGQRSLEKWLRTADFDRDVKGQFRSEHHSMGFAIFHWLCLRCGIETIKPDTHILNFVSNSIGRKVRGPEAVDLLMKVSNQQHRKPYLLDAAIWHHQRDSA